MSQVRQASERLVATNESYWSWEDDAIDVSAQVFLGDSEELRLVITSKHVKTGIGAGTRTKAYDIELGTLSRPSLGEVRTLLKKHGMERSRAGIPFKAKWKTPGGLEASLSEIIKGLSKDAGPDPERSRSELIRRIERMSPEELERAYRVILSSRREGMNDIRKKLASELVAAAKDIMSADKMRAQRIAAEPKTDEEAPVDEVFMKKVRALKQSMSALGQVKAKKLNKFGIEMIRATDTVEDLVDALLKVLPSKK